MDYYSILGIPKDATDQDIRKAYKKQSMQHHPDRGGSEEQFKKINEAYQTLKDPAKRQQYDNPQFQFNSRDFRGRDPFEDIFGAPGFGQWGRAGRPRNRDIQISYTIDLVDCFTGKNVTLRYNLPSGRVEELDITIPAGCKEGDQIRFQGYGDDSVPGNRGNLILRLKIKKYKDWTTNGLDITTTVKVSVFDLITGTDLDIQSPEGRKINLKVPKGSQSGTTFSIQGYGIPNLKRGNKGTMFVKIIGIVPTINDEETLNKIVDIKNELN